jgi:hypothetical protein
MSSKADQYLIVFNNFLKDKAIDTKIVQKNNESLSQIIGIYNNPNKTISNYYTTLTFSQNAVKVHNIEYTDTCDIRFTNMPDRYFDEMIDAQNYNYLLVNEIIKEIFNIGKRFEFYQEISTIKNIKISEAFTNNGDERYTSLKNIAKVKLSTFLKEKGSSIKTLNKFIYYNIQFLINEDNELHPIMYLFVPYCASYNFMTTINLHPSQKENQLKVLEELKNEVTIKFEQHLDGLLNRSLKIKKDEIVNMSLNDKISYIPVLEMNKI